MPGETLAHFELLVMLAALRVAPGEAYAVSIADEIEERAGRTVRHANVHTTLKRLEAKGMVSTQLGEARPERGGKPRRLVHVTREGRLAVDATLGAIEALAEGLGGGIGRFA